MAENAVTLVGSLGQDPVQRSGPKGDFTTFRLAVSPRYQDRNGVWTDGPTSWFDVNADGLLGRNVVLSLTKGQRVVVTGTVAIREGSKQDGTPTTYVQVRASAIGLDLKFGTASFTRTPRTVPADQRAEPPRPDAIAAAAPEQRGSDWNTAPLQAPQAPAAWSSEPEYAGDAPF